MADDPDTLVLDETGQVQAVGAEARARLAMQPGRYRVVPSPGNLVVLAREPSPDKMDADHEPRAASLAGDLGALGGLIEIVHFVQGAGWTGQLTAIDGAVRKTLYFARGEVRLASSNVDEDRLGAILYRYGRLDAHELEHALSRGTHEQRVGQVLVERGLIDAHELYQFVLKQVEEIFHSMLMMRRGGFYFYRTDEEALPPSQLQLSTRQLLFDSVRRMDEMSYFRQKLPGPEVVLARRDPPPAGKLDARAAKVLTLIDGERSLGDLARESHLGEFEATKVCFQLLHGRWVQVCVGVRRLRTAWAPLMESGPIDAGTEHRTRLVDAFNAAFTRVRTTIAEQGGAVDNLSRGLDAFFWSASEFAPLFVGVTVDAHGRLSPDQLLANLDMAPTDDRLAYLRRGLRELFQFTLFSAGEAVPRDREAELHTRLQAIRDELRLTGALSETA